VTKVHKIQIIDMFPTISSTQWIDAAVI